MFEPEYEVDEQVLAEPQVQQEDLALLQNTDWCRCGNCQLMPTARECVCCQTTNIVKAKLKDSNIPNANFKCITVHPGFPGVCLNPWALEVAFLTYRATNGNLPVNGANHELTLITSRFLTADRGRLGAGGLVAEHEAGETEREPCPSGVWQLGTGPGAGVKFLALVLVEARVEQVPSGQEHAWEGEWWDLCAFLWLRPGETGACSSASWMATDGEEASVSVENELTQPSEDKGADQGLAGEPSQAVGPVES
ncbi:hypothetical protein GWK47_046564 [Chionoecetes opilio]|uniref:Uncharacterized protein n=1 Tax=Chionoecetes opilio TaxID=41210 RepID=A0A8J4Y644_CHIOP|nr:hypothetical protein GWK47_046564 [Chionoecetes opilio]